MAPITATAVIDFVTVVFVLATMLSMGLALTTDEILTALGHRLLMAKSLLVNLVFVPLLAFAFVLAVPMETGHVVGLLLIAMAPGAPFGPKLAEISNSDVAFVSSLMAVLGIVSVATIPVTVALLMPGDTAADPLGIARIVGVTQLIPLIGGLGVKARYQPVATRLHPPIQRLSTILLVVLIILLTIVYAGEMRQLVGTGTLFIGWVVLTLGQIDSRNPAQLVTSGPYGFSCNPMYVAWTSLYVGLAVLFRSFWVLLLTLFVAIAVHITVRREEAELARSFGESYRSYQGRVPRYV